MTIADHVQVLADDAFEGREGGHRGGRAASSYIEQEIRPLGLIPAGAEQELFSVISNTIWNTSECLW